MLATSSTDRIWTIQFILYISIAMFVSGACSTSDRSPTQYVEDLGSYSELAGGAEMEGAPGSGSRFFPLSIGNRWTYRGAFTLRLEGDSISEVYQYAEQRELIGYEELFGREYMVETQKQWSSILPFPPDNATTYWIRNRQDKAGLYEADYFISIPPDSGAGSLAPASSTERLDVLNRETRQRRFGDRLKAAGHDGYQTALTRLGDKIRTAEAAIRATGMSRRPRRIGGPPGGVLADEITRLKYPLHPGQHWVIRDSPFFFKSHVEAYRIFSLPAGRMGGHTIRIDIDGFDKHDRVELWYGRNGFLGMRMHVKSVATDELGNPIGVLISDEFKWLVEMDVTHASP
jgi:hypothetical protein